MAVYAMDQPAGEQGSYISRASRNNNIPFESQLLSVGAGFVVFVALVAFLATVHNRRKQRKNSRDFHSPLIQHTGGHLVAVKPASNKSSYSDPPRGLSKASVLSSSPPALQSPTGSDSSGASPQCTPLTPYSSFSITPYESMATQAVPVEMQGAKQHKLGTLITDDRGSISLQLQYNAGEETLQVTILSCQDLPDYMGVSNLNPYVKLRILPDNQHRVKTRVMRGTRTPFYDEQFTMYGISQSNLKDFSLHLAVLAFDKYSRDLILGECVYNLAQPDLLNNNQKLGAALKLQPRESLGENLGQILISMANNTQSNSVNLAVLKIKDLPKDSSIGVMDPYVKVYMLVNGQRVAKQKTHVKKKTSEPVFNESFSFELGPKHQSLEGLAFQILVINHDGVTRNEVVGQCVLDVHSQHMLQIRDAPGRQVAEWHSIQAY